MKKREIVEKKKNYAIYGGGQFIRENLMEKFRKISRFPKEISHYQGDMGANAIASFNTSCLDLEKDVSEIDVTACIYKYKNLYYLEIRYEDAYFERFESYDIAELQKIATDYTYNYVKDL